MSKPASLEPTSLPGQDPPALGLKCPYPVSLQSLGHMLDWCGSRGTQGAPARVLHAPNIHSSITSMTVRAKDSGGPAWDCTWLDSETPHHPGEQTHPRAAVLGLSITRLQHFGFKSALPAVAGLQAPPLDTPSSAGAVTIPTHHWHPGHLHHHRDVFLPQMPSPWELLCREELGCVSFCLWPTWGLVVLCFCSCCTLTAKVSLYTEYLQILIYICISFCYSIFICLGSTNDVFFLFTDATGQENDGGFVWPVGFVCVTIEDAGLY